MLRSLKNIYSRWLLRSLKGEKPEQPASWDAVERIALVVSHDPTLNKSGIDRFVQETGKYVEVFYVETGSRKATYGDWRCLTREHKSFLGTPTKAVLKELRSSRYDLVINAGGDHYSAVLSAAFDAPVKCSSTRQFNEADLVITNTNGLGDYLSQVLRYMQMIRAKQR